MAVNRIEPIAQQLRRAVLRHEDAQQTDGRLLDRFLATGDADAFEALLRRHGPMVLGVCRRVLRNPHDADDAFQATFLVLARKAASVSPRERVGNWLYGVAHTTALRARVADARRRSRERQVMTMPEPEAMPKDPWDDLHAVLDEELARLPDKYRTAVVLCDLEGRPRKEVARQLRLPEGTLSSRLTTARRLLAKRLTRRGLTVTGGALAAALSPHAVSAGVPVPLLKSTVEAATLFAAVNAATAGVVSARVAALMKGVLKTMLLKKLKTVAMVLTVAILVGGAGLLYRTQAAEPARAGSQPGEEGTTLDKLAGSGTPGPGNLQLLSSRPLPRQALVGLEKGQLVVRTLDVMYEPTAVQFEGQTRISYQKAEILRTMHLDLNMVKVYDVRGKVLAKRELPDRLGKDTLALISSDPHAADPLNLCLFKEGTLLFVLPALTLPPRPATLYPAATTEEVIGSPAAPYPGPAPVAPRPSSSRPSSKP